MNKIIKVLLGIVAVLVVAQFVPYGKNHTNPPIIAEPTWDSPQTREIFMRACGNCHSNETIYPKYSSFAPVSWLIARDVEEGRSKLNISEWGKNEENEADEAANEVREGAMPPWFYMPTHPEAKLTNEEKIIFIKGLVATFGDKKEK